MYRTLDSEKIIETIQRLKRRIGERFPGAGLGLVCDELLALGLDARNRVEWIARPLLPLRIAVGLAIVLIVTGLIEAILFFDDPEEKIDVAEFVQIVEPAMNVVVLIGAALIFLVTIEARVKRSRALKAISELRALAHVVDMHQLTKDPERTGQNRLVTPSSPPRTLSRFELSRYLDYCSEMLSLIGKIGAIYAQSFNDATALAAVNEVETLTTGLARKIWQKIMILNRSSERGVDADGVPARTEQP